ncbi:MAG TPA: VOC family protein [Saprospiraceae bacterium]|nr:VOC family protein [Saprospiraceae bacterium]
MKATSIIPCLSYKDAPAAIEWLCKAFGFEKQLIVPGENDTIAHSELSLGGNLMIMVSSMQNNSEFLKMIKLPADIGGFVTQSPYIVVDDPDALYAQAVSHGAKIALDIKTEDYGGRGFSCFDPEGHLWNFGSYNPWD